MKVKKAIPTEDYLHALAELPPKIQKKALKKADELSEGKIANGMNYEPLNFPDPSFRSVRIGKAHRLILSEQEDSYILLWVDKHDEAYNWAKNRRSDYNRESETIKVIKTVVEERKVPVYTYEGEELASPNTSPKEEDSPPGAYLKHVSNKEMRDIIPSLSDDVLKRLRSYVSYDEAYDNMESELKEILSPVQLDSLLDFLTGKTYEVVKIKHLEELRKVSGKSENESKVESVAEPPDKKRKSTPRKKKIRKATVDGDLLTDKTTVQETLNKTDNESTGRSVAESSDNKRKSTTRRATMPEEINVAGHWLVSLEKLDDQQKYIAALKPSESYLVEGCAGSGKSVLAMIKFNQLCQDGKHPVYATMMRGLTDTIISEVMGSCDEGMAAAKEYVCSTTEKKRSSGHGKPWFYSSSCIGTCYMLPCINPDNPYPLKGDNLVLDECQDLSYEDFRKIVKSGEYQSICWYGDDDQQLCDNIDGEETHLRLQEIFDECLNGYGSEKWHKLKWNYRISPNVAKFIDAFQKNIPEARKLLSPSARGKRTDKPYLFGYPSRRSEIDSIVNIIVNRGWNGRDGHKTAILVGGSNEQVEKVYLLIKEGLEKAVGFRHANVQRRRGPIDRNQNDFMTADPSCPVVVSTPLQSKGCQFDSVFILANTFGRDDGHILFPGDLNSIHVAMTRSGGELFVFYIGEMPPAFAKIPSSLYEASVEDSPKNPDDIGLA